MSASIPDNMGDFGERTSASRWTAGTHIDMCNVPWDAQYRDIVNFDTMNALNDYLDQSTIVSHSITKAQRVAPLEPVRVNVPFDEAFKCNYLRVRSPETLTWIDDDNVSRETSPHTYYYFILSHRYIAPNTTELIVQVDMWQTYKWFANFGRAIVERGHVGIANNARMAENGRVHLTVPEGFNLGNDYVVQHVERQTIVSRFAEGSGVMVWSTVSLDKSGGNVDNPVLVTAGGSRIHGLPNGAECYYFDNTTAFYFFMQKNANRPWVTQGIVSIQLIPTLKRYTSYDYTGGDSSGGPYSLHTLHLGERENALLNNWRDGLLTHFPAEYRHLSKFLTYPYTVLEVTTNTGTPIVLKPEMLNGSAVTLVEHPYFAIPNARLGITVRDYGASSTGYVSQNNHLSSRDRGEYLDIMTGIMNFPTFSTVNNSYAAFLASNSNSLAYAHQSADWSQQRALQGAQTAYDSATLGIGASRDLSQSQILTSNQMLANVNAHADSRTGFATGMDVFGAATSLATLNPAGALSALTSAVGHNANNAISQSERTAATGISNAAINRNLGITTSLAQGVRDNNLSLAQFSAKGDYANAIAGINAKVEDAKLTQPTTSGQVGGDAFTLATNGWGYDVKIKTIPPNAMRTIGNYWLRFGYLINSEMSITTLSVMEKFTYWKMSYCTLIDTTLPESVKNTIRAIFEKGVTVWKNPNHIGRVNIKDNKPIYGDYYN